MTGFGRYKGLGLAGAPGLPADPMTFAAAYLIEESPQADIDSGLFSSWVHRYQGGRPESRGHIEDKGMDWQKSILYGFRRYIPVREVWGSSVSR